MGEGYKWLRRVIGEGGVIDRTLLDHASSKTDLSSHSNLLLKEL